MHIRQTLEDTASDFVSQVAVPVAERVRDSADDLIDRIGAESRQLSEKVGSRVSTQLEHLPETALKRLNLVTARQARRRTILGVLVGFVLGAVIVRLFTGEDGARRRHSIMEKVGMEEPRPAAAVTGDLPQ